MFVMIVMTMILIVMIVMIVVDENLARFFGNAFVAVGTVSRGACEGSGKTDAVRGEGGEGEATGRGTGRRRRRRRRGGSVVYFAVECASEGKGKGSRDSSNDRVCEGRRRPGGSGEEREEREEREEGGRGREGGEGCEG